MNDAPYFASLGRALAEAGRYQPTLVIDRDRLDANADIVARRKPPERALRLVDKSLAVPELLARLMTRLQTNKVMSFHLPIARAVLAAHANVEILFGKPMPTAALRQALAHATTLERQALSLRTVHLVDSAERLAAYAELAASLDIDLRVAAEIDVGMHRGGFSSPEALRSAFAARRNSRIRLEGVMGYEAHIAKIPGFVGGATGERARVLDRYKAFVAVLSPDEHRILNIGGSNTALGYGPDLATEISMGSAFLKPTDFDSKELTELAPALFIATPILKRVTAQLPGPSFLTKLMQTLGKFPREGCFLYGGKWMATAVHPPGMRENLLWGHSSNQQFMALPDGSPVREGDFAFLRPSQSEAVLQQFGAIAVYSDGRIVEDWMPLPPG
ncbi:D-serine deaminase-like pyridoxal phosphate-dependent protein [Rhizobium sp. SG_E_25_P2]|uniref:alanine racemase n=1 Tax=Rhizobium sp. SG_E_25_P2 TaxID=2879942 RepID=UPI002476F198|nr:alanine racemase [Rhizobium sp. SG_E_25_P2]MDH6264911.1 D-serine deaminase-like pyridoxal phosphate-dependent protein [Rhizobium sp. SG_E_25_P2]